MVTKRTTLSTDVEVWVETFTGTVIGSDHRSHTEVHQGRAMPDGKGNMIPGEVYSVVRREHELWLRSERGAERQFVFTDANFPTRAGHKVTVVWGGTGKSGPYLGAYNHTTRAAWEPRHADLQALSLGTAVTGFCRFVAIFVIGWGAASGLGALLAGEPGFAFGVVGGFVVSMVAGLIAGARPYQVALRELRAFARAQMNAAIERAAAPPGSKPTTAGSDPQPA